MKSMDKLRKSYEEVSSKKSPFLEVFANLSLCFSLCFLQLCWDVLLTFKDLEYISAGTMAQLEKQFAASQKFLNGLTELRNYGEWSLCR